jgi:hypothetical protein
VKDSWLSKVFEPIIQAAWPRDPHLFRYGSNGLSRSLAYSPLAQDLTRQLKSPTAKGLSPDGLLLWDFPQLKKLDFDSGILGEYCLPVIVLEFKSRTKGQTDDANRENHFYTLEEAHLYGLLALCWQFECFQKISQQTNNPPTCCKTWSIVFTAWKVSIVEYSTPLERWNPEMKFKWGSHPVGENYDENACSLISRTNLVEIVDMMTNLYEEAKVHFASFSQ